MNLQVNNDDKGVLVSSEYVLIEMVKLLKAKLGQCLQVFFANVIDI